MIKTLTKFELFNLLDKYPDDTRIEITVTEVDLKSCKENGNYWGFHDNQIDFYVFGLPKDDYSYNSEEKILALQVWSENDN